MRIILGVFASIVLTACQSSDRGSAMQAQTCLLACAAQDQALADILDPVINAAAETGFAGQLVVMKDGNVVYDRAAGFADLAEKIPVTDETLYQVSSMVKFFTATLALKAVEEGKLNLDDNAADLFPDTALASRDFTLRDILSHHSGLRSTYAAESESSPAQALAAIAEANKENRKDEKFHYSNDAYDALGIALERIYAKPYEEVFREKLAAPAGLKHFAFWGEGELDDPHVRGQPLRPAPAELKGRNYGMIGSAGLLISTSDLVRFRRALDEGKILGPAMTAELNKPRGKIRIGDVLYGAFLIDTPLGLARSARGIEDWGDNAYLNDYPECGYIIAVVTSRGPAIDSGKPLFRDQIIKPVEQRLAPHCTR